MPIVEVIVIQTGRPPQPRRDVFYPLGEEIVVEFENLLMLLDDRIIRRAGWDRIKTLVTIATLDAGDVERGRMAFERALAKWKQSEHYDGTD